jgi:ribosomal protein S16
VFDRSVFINCPFDADYRPLLNAILFCTVYAELLPRIATERADAGESRLDKISQIARQSRFSIHDLSRCQAMRVGDIARMNMPFELGLDYGLRISGEDQLARKRFLVMDEKPHRLRQALSDIGGWDPIAHEGKAELVMKNVRNWLRQEAQIALPGGEVLSGLSLEFDEWKYLEPNQARADVDSYEPFELIDAMQRWNAARRAESNT